MRFNGSDTLWDWNDIITLTLLEFGMDIPLAAITLVMTPVGALAPLAMDGTVL